MLRGRRCGRITNSQASWRGIEFRRLVSLPVTQRNAHRIHREGTRLTELVDEQVKCALDPYTKVLLPAVLAFCTWSSIAAADDVLQTANQSLPEASIARSLPVTGDPFDFRTRLAEVGITYGVKFTGEVLGNPTGGIKRGSAYDGLVSAFLDIDYEKLAGFKGLSGHVSGYQIHGTGHVTKDNLGSLVAASNIEALNGTLLFEAWLEQKLASGKLAIRYGQLAADQEFLISDTAGPFVANTFGWAVLPSIDLPSGGPAYPLATPGVRIRFDPTEQLAALLAIYNGDPAAPGEGDQQERDPNGLAFRLKDPPLLLGEMQWKHGQQSNARELPGVIKVGGWYHFGKFVDQRLSSDGLSLADPASLGEPAKRRGNFAIYGVVDQQLYRSPGGVGKTGASSFARIVAAPSDVNFVDFYADMGLVFSGFVPGRPDDSFGVALGYSRVSDSARDRDRDAVAFGTGSVVHNHETIFEVNYQAQVSSGWTVQPWFQYIWSPSAPDDTLAIENASVLGFRTSVSYIKGSPHWCRLVGSRPTAELDCE